MQLMRLSLLSSVMTPRNPEASPGGLHQVHKALHRLADGRGVPQHTPAGCRTDGEGSELPKAREKARWGGAGRGGGSCRVGGVKAKQICESKFPWSTVSFLPYSVLIYKYFDLGLPFY